MGTGTIVAVVGAGVVALAGFTYAGTYNGFQKKDVQITTDERKIASCYQKRSDLFSNLEAAVERGMKQEKDVVLGNAQARAASTSGRASLPDNATPEQIKEFMAAQAGLGQRMTQLLATVEAVPNVASLVNLAKFQKDIKDTEQQCSILRTRYIDTVGSYNKSLKTFPSNIVASVHNFTTKEQIKFDDEVKIKSSPRVFGAK